MTRGDEVARRLRRILRTSTETANPAEALAAESAAAAERARGIVDEPRRSDLDETEGGVVSRSVSGHSEVRHPEPPASAEPVEHSRRGAGESRSQDFSEHAELLLANRIIVLSGEVDDAVANTITAQLLLLEADDPTADITFLINSSGGSVTAGVAILDTMNLVKPDVATCAMGLAAGIAQLLVSSGTPGKRSAIPRAMVAFSLPQTPDPSPLQAALLDKWTGEVVRLIAECSGQPADRIRDDAERRRQFTAAEAVEYGLLDRVTAKPVLG